MSPLPEDKRLQFIPEDQRPPLTPRLARRVAMIGTFALAIFAILYFRLWFLQVLSGDQYAHAASVNFIRDVEVAAPRGNIIDSSGHVLALSQRAYAVDISPPSLPVALDPGALGKPPQRDAALYVRLARVLGIPTKRQKCKVGILNQTTREVHVEVFHISQIACEVVTEYVQLPYAEATVATDITQQQLWYLSERQASFPSVSVQRIYQRVYPLKTVAAQVLGSVGRISCISRTNCELNESQYKGASENDIVGQSGLEAAYNRYLQGTDGANQVKVDALGDFEGYLSQKSPVPGDNLKLSLDSTLQQVGEQGLQESLDNNYPANGGAFVAMDPQNGQVYAMGSLPTYDANIFNGKPIPESEYAQLNNATSNFPLINRAIQSVGPTGSTFKPITATAALESGAWTTNDVFDDTGQYCFSGQCRHNAGGAVDGALDLVNAIKVSSDDFFYNLGVLTNNPAPNGGALQHWAHLYGIGRKTGIDLPDELTGNLPSPKWRTEIDQVELNCEKAHHVPASEYFQPGVSCGIADGRPWSAGDNENLAVGQGDVQVSPLQLAVAYSAIANGGTIITPHIGLDVQAPDGTVIQTIDPKPARHIDISPFYLQTIRDGLRAAASQPGGTSADVFQNFPEQVYGKTGTAQYNGQQDYAWYACFVPSWATGKPIVVVATVEQGGFGAVGAAPVARQILSQWFFGSKGAYVPGNSKTL